MPTVQDWEEWDELEDKIHEDSVREKINHKSKTHNKEEWEKLDERLQKNNNVKFVKSKRRKVHKNNNHHHS